MKAKERVIDEDALHERFRRYSTSGVFWCARDARGLVLCKGGLYGHYLELFSNVVKHRNQAVMEIANTRDEIMETVRDFNSKCLSRLVKVHPVRVNCELLEVRGAVKRRK